MTFIRSRAEMVTRDSISRIKHWIVLGCACACILSAFLFGWSIFLLPKATAADENSAPYAIEWPADWQVIHSSLPRSESGAQFDGARVTATRVVDGNPAAVIALVYIRGGGDASGLDEYYEGMLETLKAGFEDAGLSVSISRSAGSLAGQTSIEAQVTAIGADVNVQQSISIVASDDYTFTIVFSGPKAEFEQYWDTYQGVLTTLKIM